MSENKFFELNDEALDQVAGGTGAGVTFEYEIGERVELTQGACRAGNQHWSTPWGVITGRYEQGGQPWYRVRCESCGFECDGYPRIVLGKVTG